ncbi:hypothetical protein K788_0004965 (plasmid) [Paraburkholderia caribensis MBA4]|uniref:Uncharacterized protein n=1 Tax=Paraburkholderia caribensis MBA4 TaxID=1323664 RepID=A0A0P0RL69_9BURK|nr:hypothetical protein K788_0004965 [Paraburkholderia caribensis MBA4]
MPLTQCDAETRRCALLRVARCAGVCPALCHAKSPSSSILRFRNHTKYDSKNHTTIFCVQLKTSLCGPGLSLAAPGVLLARLENSGMHADLV